jgi:hypothetical protein
MGNACCSDNRDFSKTEGRLPLVQKPLLVMPIDVRSDEFGDRILLDCITPGERVRISLRKFGLYKFEHSVADLRGSESLPVKLARNDEYTYVGQMLGSKPHGKGHLLTHGGDLFVSPFHEGQPKGEGAVYFANGDFFNGRLVLGDLEDGKLEYHDGTVYKGQFLNKKRHGMGVFTYLDGTKYDGYWADDRENGKGKLIIPGIWKDGRRLHGAFLSEYTGTPVSRSAIAIGSSEVQEIKGMKPTKATNPVEIATLKIDQQATDSTQVIDPSSKD